MILALALVGVAWPCDEGALRLRTVQPADGAVDVPPDVRVAVSFIGEGEADHYTVALYDGDAAVEASQSAGCYEHEGPLEWHCWIALRPVEALAPDRTYTVQIRSTDAHTGALPEQVSTRFTTGDTFAVSPASPPEFTLAEAWDPAPEELGPCDYTTPRRYTLLLTPAQPDPSALSLYHVYTHDPTGERPAALVHTMFVTNPKPDPDDTGAADGPTEFKQYLDGSTAPTDCFGVVQEDPAGRAGPLVVACWDPSPEDTADSTPPDSSPTDSSPPDSGPSDSEPGADSAPGPADTGAAAEPAPPPPGACGCGAGAGAVGLLGIVWTRRRRDCGGFWR